MNDRLGWLLVGCVVGFILGYTVRSLREIKEKVEQVDQHLKKEHPDEGFIIPDWAKNITLLVVVLLTLYASIQSQIAANDSDRSTDKIQTQQNTINAQQSLLAAQQKIIAAQQVRTDKLVTCDQQFLAQTIGALNARTAYTQSQNAANVDLQKSLSNLVTLSLQIPPLSAADARHVVEGFSAALKHFLEISAKSANQVDNNPYPTPTAFQDCLSAK